MKTFYYSLLFVFLYLGTIQLSTLHAQDEFILEANFRDGETFTIPTNGGGYNYTVDWGDGSSDTNVTGDISHTYSYNDSAVRLFEVTITGDFPQPYFNNSYTQTTNFRINQWGTTQWRSMENAFAGIPNILILARDTPDLSSATSLSGMFSGVNSIADGFGTIPNWDTSNIEDISAIFKDLRSNIDISSWDVSSVTDASEAFLGSNFNRDLSGWDISSVTDLSGMFDDSNMTTTNYEATMQGWATLSAGETQIPSNVTLGAEGIIYNDTTNKAILANDYGWTFTGATLEWDEADKYITTWKTNASGVSGFNNDEIIIAAKNSYNYYYAVDWGDGTITYDHTGNAEHTYDTVGTYTVKIYGDFPAISPGINTSFMVLQLQSVDQWGAIAWETMNEAFNQCQNVDVLATDTPDLSNVTDLSHMFFECSNLGGTNSGVIDLSGWNTSTITNMSNMFTYCETLTSANIGNWDVSKVSDFSYMFSSTDLFNENLNNWNIGTNVTGNIEMTGMFELAKKFNSPLSNWDVTNVFDFVYFLRGAAEFDQDLGDWNVATAYGLEGMLDFTAMSVENYDKTLEGWATVESGETIQTFASFGAAGVGYGDETYRDILKNTYSWTFNGDIHEGIEEDKFITTWTVTDGDLSIPIYTFSSDNVSYDYTVDWGDGSIETDITDDTSHTYATAGTYTVKFMETFRKCIFLIEQVKRK